MEEQIAGLDFTVDWFSKHIPLWEQLLELLPEREKFLELGSFEGQSACWLLKHAVNPNGSLYCIDTWQGSREFNGCLDKSVIEKSFDRFQRNVKAAGSDGQHLFIFRNRTISGLAELIHGGHEKTFDFIYVDAGHRAYETLTDGVMSWPLLKSGGIMVFDDLLWELNKPLEVRPKIAIDAFTAIFSQELQIVANGSQLAAQKR